MNLLIQNNCASALRPSHGITDGMAKTISMQGALQHIMEYVYNMAALMSPTDVQALADEQAGKAVDLITTCKVDPITSYEDGNAALLELQSGRCLWSADQKSKLAAAIRVNVEGTKARGSDQQDNQYSAEYMPEWIWDLIKSHCDINHVFEHVATHCVVKLKLRSPSEPTRRDLVAMCLAGRCVTPTAGESLTHIELMRKHFECARSIHPGVKGPATYPSDPNLFLKSLAVKLEDADLAVASKVSKHALSLLVASTCCRKKKEEALYSVKSETRIVKKQPQEELKSEDAVDHIARFVAGEIESRDVAALPGVSAVLRGCGPTPSDEALVDAVLRGCEPHPMSAPPLAQLPHQCLVYQCPMSQLCPRSLSAIWKSCGASRPRSSRWAAWTCATAALCRQRSGRSQTALSWRGQPLRFHRVLSWRGQPLRLQPVHRVVS